jgi:exonuclease III
MTNSVSFLHLNIQSIVPKLDFIIAEYSCHDILSFTESWLKPDISTDSLKFPGYKPPYRRDRVDRLGGGVVVFVKDEISCVTRLDLQVGSVECIWLEIKINNKKYLYGTFYIPPNSGQQIWEELEQSIDLALNSNHDIIITGDFNINQFGNITTKTDNLLAQFSFHQLITEPTYVTERSSSLLDLVLVNNPHGILYSEVGPPLLDQTRYHMPTIGVLNHPIKSHSSY